MGERGNGGGGGSSLAMCLLMFTPPPPGDNLGFLNANLRFPTNALIQTLRRVLPELILADSISRRQLS